jgi:membrane protein YdbS with pleckstrin-like domain
MDDWFDIFLQSFGDDITRSGTGWLLSWISDGAGEAIVRENGRAVARYGQRVKITIACFACMFAVLAIFALVGAHGSEKWIATPFVIFLLICVMCLIDMHKMRIEFARDTLFVQSWRGNRTIPWSAVESVDYSEWGGGHVLRAGSFGKVRISDLLGGSYVLVHFARAQIRERRWKRDGHSHSG